MPPHRQKVHGPQRVPQKNCHFRPIDLGPLCRSSGGDGTGERMQFWANILFSPPLYGADLVNTLMDEHCGEWNLNLLDSLLRQAVPENLRGVTSSYCYVGSWKSLFCWHKEDLDLSAINYLHEGKSKFWYSIPEGQGELLER